MGNLSKYYYALSSFFFKESKVDNLNRLNLERIKKNKDYPCVVLHGSSTNYRRMYNTLKILEEQGIISISVGYNVKDSVEKSARKIKRGIEKILKDTNKKKTNLVGICLGGLVGRYYIELLNGKPKINKFISVYTPVRPIPKKDSGYFLCRITGGRPDLYNRAMKKLKNKQIFKNYTRIVSEADRIIKPEYSIVEGYNNYLLNEGHLFVSFNPKILKKIAGFLRE